MHFRFASSPCRSTDVATLRVDHMKAAAVDASSLVASLAEFDTATLCESNGGGALSGDIHALTLDSRVGGLALTVLCPPGDNLAIHLAVAAARPGEVLVVQTSDPAYGVWGEVLTVAAMARGIKAVILDGSVRDIDSIRAHGFPVFGRGCALNGTVKKARGEVRVPVMCGGQIVWPGDVVVADVSGIVAIRASNAATVAAEAAARRD